MNKKPIKTQSNTPKQFKDDVLDFLKKHGLMFPVTNEEVELFEKIYGSTDFELPDELKDSDAILEWGAKIYKQKQPISEYTAMAAHGGKKISKETIKKMKNIHEKVVKNSKK